MDGGLFRKKSLDRISSPEDLHDYMRVTSPRLWMLLGTIAALLVGLIVLAATLRMESTEKIRVRVGGEGYVTGRIPVDRQDLVKIGMPVRFGEWTGKITQIDNSAEEHLKVTFASGEVPEGDSFFLTPGDVREASAYREDGSFNTDLIYVYETEGEFFLIAEDAPKIGSGETQVRFWSIHADGDELKLEDGRLATISGTETMVTVTVTVTLDDPAARPERGYYDAEIVTENTSPISFLLN